MNTHDLIAEGRRLLRDVNHRFGHTGDEDDQARDILTFVLGRDPRDGDPVDPAARRRFFRLVERRATGEPLPYIVGWTEFGDMRLHIRKGGFVPRTSTEFLATQAIRRIRARKQPVAVDLACGIGPVALMVAKHVRRAEVHGLDIAASAIKQARQNAASLRLRNAHFHTGDMYAPLPRRLRGRVDAVTMHPPYVPRGEVRDLPVEFKRFEPRESLTDRSDDGLGLVRRAAAEGRDWLRPDGWLLIEIAPAGSNDVRRIMRDHGYRDLRSTTGPIRFTRVVVARRG